VPAPVLNNDIVIMNFLFHRFAARVQPYRARSDGST
jgi:hypothetical protein